MRPKADRNLMFGRYHYSVPLSTYAPCQYVVSCGEGASQSTRTRKNANATKRAPKGEGRREGRLLVGPEANILACATSLAALHRRAWNCPEGAENTAIARKGLKSLSASLAVIKELASVHRHAFDPLMAALGTSDSGLFVHNCGSLVCTMASRICIASAVPSASPFSKSWAVCPIVLVTGAIHRTLACRTLASV